MESERDFDKVVRKVGLHTMSTHNKLGKPWGTVLINMKEVGMGPGGFRR